MKRNGTTSKGTTWTNLRAIKSNHTHLETNRSSRLISIVNGIKDCRYP